MIFATLAADQDSSPTAGYRVDQQLTGVGFGVETRLEQGEHGERAAVQAPHRNSHGKQDKLGWLPTAQPARARALDVVDMIVQLSAQFGPISCFGWVAAYLIDRIEAPYGSRKWMSECSSTIVSGTL